jgi:hypothetical protein
MSAEPIASIIAAQHPRGYWQKPGAGYATKYRDTVWQVMFLDQLGADGGDPRIHAACEYVLAHTLSPGSGFGASGVIHDTPPPSRVIHCLNGNLLRAVLGFGWWQDARVQQAVNWQARAITSEAPVRFYAAGTNGPGFCCAANRGNPCAWGGHQSVARARPSTTA